MSGRMATIIRSRKNESLSSPIAGSLAEGGQAPSPGWRRDSEPVPKLVVPLLMARFQNGDDRHNADALPKNQKSACPFDHRQQDGGHRRGGRGQVNRQHGGGRAPTVANPTM